MPEWSIGAVSKTVVPLRAPRVRIPVFPQRRLGSASFRAFCVERRDENPGGFVIAKRFRNAMEKESLSFRKEGSEAPAFGLSALKAPSLLWMLHHRAALPASAIVPMIPIPSPTIHSHNALYILIYFSKILQSNIFVYHLKKRYICAKYTAAPAAQQKSNTKNNHI